MNPILEKIDTAEKKLVQFKKLAKQVFDEANADGVIDAEEKKEIALVAGQIKAVQDVIQRLKDEFARNMAEWVGHSSDYAELQDQISQLREAGESDVGTFEKAAAEIDVAVEEQFWKDATTLLLSCMASIRPVFDEMIANQTDDAHADTPGSEGDETPDVPGTQEEIDRQMAQQVEDQIPNEVTILIENDDDDVLASPEFPFLLHQEISVGCPFGEIKVKFNDRGQIESATIARPIIPGVTLAGGAYGLVAKVEVKPYSGALKLSKQGGNLKLEFELSASGSGFIGIGAGKGDAWAGIGIDLEVKVARTETITAELVLETLQEIAMSASAMPMPMATFTPLPASFVLSGEQSLVAGASAPKGAASFARKLVLKSYPDMATLTIFEDSGGLGCDFETGDSLAEMAEDIGRQMIPMVDMLFRAQELAEEIQRFVDDPEAYSEEKRREAEEMRRRLLALPGDLIDFVDGELHKLDKLDGEIAAQLEEWGDAVEDAIDGAMDAVGDEIGDAQDALANAYDQASDYVKEQTKEAYDKATDYLEEKAEEAKEALDEAKDYVEEKAKEAKEALDEAKDYVEEKAEEAKDEATDYIEEKVEEAREAFDEVADRVEEKAKEAKEAIDEASDYLEEKADELVDGVLDFFKR